MKRYSNDFTIKFAIPNKSTTICAVPDFPSEPDECGAKRFVQDGLPQVSTGYHYLN